MYLNKVILVAGRGEFIVVSENADYSKMKVVSTQGTVMSVGMLELDHKDIVASKDDHNIVLSVIASLLAAKEQLNDYGKAVCQQTVNKLAVVFEVVYTAFLKEEREAEDTKLAAIRAKQDLILQQFVERITV